MTYNSELAKLFFEIADAMELKGNIWEPRAYRKAAFAIDGIEDVRKIYKKNGIKSLEEIPSVGKAIASKIEEYIKTGKIRKHEELTGKLPKELIKIIELPGIGPKTAKKLYYELKIKKLSQLEKAAKKGKIKKLEGFGKKSEEEILDSISRGLKQKSRQPYEKIYPLAKKILKKVKKWKEVQKAELAGSLRRKEPTIGDIDIIASSKKPKKVVEKFTKINDVQKVIAKGKTKGAVWLKNNFEADIRVVDSKSYGATLQYFTGPKNFNIKLRKLAIKKGYKLSEYGLFKRKTGKRVAGKTEKSIFKKLGVDYIKPEKSREAFSKE